MVKKPDVLFFQLELHLLHHGVQKDVFPVFRFVDLEIENPPELRYLRNALLEVGSHARAAFNDVLLLQFMHGAADGNQAQFKIFHKVPLRRQTVSNLEMLIRDQLEDSHFCLIVFQNTVHGALFLLLL